MLHTPLLPASLGSSLDPPTTIRDPCVFNDVDTGAYYIVFGTFEYYIARLGEDMVSLAEAPRHLTVVNAMGPFGTLRSRSSFATTGCTRALAPYPRVCVAE